MTAPVSPLAEVALALSAGALAALVVVLVVRIIWDGVMPGRWRW